MDDSNQIYINQISGSKSSAANLIELKAILLRDFCEYKLVNNLIFLYWKILIFQIMMRVLLELDFFMSKRKYSCCVLFVMS